MWGVAGFWEDVSCCGGGGKEILKNADFFKATEGTEVPEFSLDRITGLPGLFFAPRRGEGARRIFSATKRQKKRMGGTRLPGATPPQSNVQSLLTSNPAILWHLKGVLDTVPGHLSARGERNPRGKPKAVLFGFLWAGKGAEGTAGKAGNEKAGCRCRKF